MQVVIDTNILISGIFWGGLPYKVLNHWTDDHFEVITSETVLEEYFQTLKQLTEERGRPEIYQHWSGFIAQNSRIVIPQKHFKICRDPKDNKFLDCAISGRASFIITGDNDLLSIGQLMTVEIINPKKFLSRF
ncbi:MAG: putative toxin-antitoxin system toxin component, PIN family [Bdellovibrio sp.]|nr:putative toxin-antitoxin system toxin component, PIN family [Bdellovibrio sp.]